MLLDAFHNTGGERQGGTSGDPVRGRLVAGVRGVEEGLELGVEWLDVRSGQFFKGKFGLRAWALYADAQSIATGIIERDIFVLLEEAHFADAFGGNARSGDIGDGAAGKFKPRVGDIHFVCQHWDAYGFDFGHWFLYEREQNIQVVNHQVVDDLHVEAARRENAEAVNFEKKRAVKNWFDRYHRRVKTLDVAHLQNTIVTACFLEKGVSLHKIHGHGLLDKDVQATGEKMAAHLGVCHGWNGDARGFREFADFVETAQCFGLKLGCDDFSAGLILVVDADQLRVLQFAVHAGVVASKFPCSNDSGADFSGFWCRPAHSLFIPLELLFGSACAGGTNA